MDDRVSTYPGRVTMVPVDGRENTYDMTMADEPTQDGTPPTKATLLKDATAELFGLDASAVPDDVFAWLGKYAQYWWRRRQPTTVYTTTESPSTKQVYIIYNPGSTSATRSISYSDSVSVDQSGAISLVNPKTVDVSYSNRDTTVAGTLAGKYVTNLYTDPSTVYKFATTPAYGRDTSKYSLYFGSGDVTVVSSVATSGYTDWEYLQSNNRNAYPDSGESGGYEYDYIGVPFDNAVTASKIATGSYTGTGTFGSSNPNSLTFDFEPKALFLFNGDVNSGMKAPMLLVSPYTNQEFVQETSGGRDIIVSWGKTVTWYSPDGNEKVQFNSNYGQNYYFAIG